MALEEPIHTDDFEDSFLHSGSSIYDDMLEEDDIDMELHEAQKKKAKSISRMNQHTERKKSLDESDGKLEPPSPCKTCTRACKTFCLSTITNLLLLFLVSAYVIFGGVLFFSLESRLVRVHQDYLDIEREEYVERGPTQTHEDGTFSSPSRDPPRHTKMGPSPLLQGTHPDTGRWDLLLPFKGPTQTHKDGTFSSPSRDPPRHTKMGPSPPLQGTHPDTRRWDLLLSFKGPTQTHEDGTFFSPSRDPPRHTKMGPSPHLQGTHPDTQRWDLLLPSRDDGQKYLPSCTPILSSAADQLKDAPLRPHAATSMVVSPLTLETLFEKHCSSTAVLLKDNLISRLPLESCG
nr:hypothetical protein BgiMline_025408 [Biomphalaria glabrata]